MPVAAKFLTARDISSLIYLSTRGVAEARAQAVDDDDEPKAEAIRLWFYREKVRPMKSDRERQKLSDEFENDFTDAAKAIKQRKQKAKQSPVSV